MESEYINGTQSGGASGMIRIYDSENTLLYTIRKVLNANFRETIDGEISFFRFAPR